MTAAPPFFTRYGFSDVDAETRSLRIEPYPELCTAGALRATVIASAIDIVGALCTREIAGADLTFTSDLSLRIPRPSIPAALGVRGECLRAGGRLVTTGVTLFEGDAVWGYGETTFSRIPRDPAEAPDLSKLIPADGFPQHRLDRPLEDEVGIETIDAEAGRIRVPLRPDVLNPEGVMQGALVALVAECAALACADARSSRPNVVRELDLRYLAGASKGPVTSESAWIGDPTAGMLRVALRDEGKDGRITTTALVRTGAASG